MEMTTTHTQPAGCDLDPATIRAVVEKSREFYLGYLSRHIPGDDIDAVRATVTTETAVRAIAFDLRAAQAPQGDTRQGAPKDTPESMAGSNARFAIDGAIQFGRENRNAPPSTDHWLYEYWNIGQQLRRLGETGWDNVTPMEESHQPQCESHHLAQDCHQAPAAHTCTPAGKWARREQFVAYWRARFQYSADHAFLDEAGNFCTPSDDPIHMNWKTWNDARAAQGASRAVLDLGSIDANKLEAMAKEMPDECFLRGSGVLKLIGAIRQLEQAALARAPLPAQADGQAVDDARDVARLDLLLDISGFHFEIIGQKQHLLDARGRIAGIGTTKRDAIDAALAAKRGGA
jgi:hypothetical protein